MKTEKISTGTRIALIIIVYFVGVGVRSAADFFVYLITQLPWVDTGGIAFGIIIVSLSNVIIPMLGYLISIGGVIYFALPWLRDLRAMATSVAPIVSTESPLQQELAQAIARVQSEPEKAKPAWDLARVRLELYFDRNLSQINYIFWLSVVVMMVGFGFILFGISQTFTPTPTGATDAISQDSGISPAVVGVIAGIITEFIGATFLFIYRSTIQQASAYTRTLERINSVGMAMQILDTISGEAKELQDQTKADIVKMLLSQSKGWSETENKVEKQN